MQRKLTSLAGYQAEGDIGRWFREAHTRDFDSFKQRYFTPNTQEKSCFVKAGGKHECTIEGSLKLAALKTDLRKIVKTKERVLSDSLVFFLSSADAVDAAAKQGTEAHARYFVDQLEGVFVRRGHRIVFGERIPVNRTLVELYREEVRARIELRRAGYIINQDESK